MNFMEVGSFRLIPALVSTVGILALFLSGCGSCSGSMLSGDAAERGEAGDDVSGADDISSADEHVEDTADPPGEDTAYPPEEVPDVSELPEDISCIERPTNTDADEIPIATWSRVYSGIGDDQPEYVKQTPDGGFVAAGNTDSFGSEGYTYWIVRLDAQGTVLWQKALDSPNDEIGLSIDVVAGGGYIAAGQINFQSPREDDFVVMRLTDEGEPLWVKILACSNVWGSSPYIIACGDGGYLLSGSTHCFGAGEISNWIVKLNDAGDVEWEKLYECGMCFLTVFEQTADGGFMAAGGASDEDRGQDFLVVKLDSAGNLQWQKTYGRSNDDYALDAIQTADCGYIVAGASYSMERERRDVLIIKLDADGHIVNHRSFGEDKENMASSIVQTPDDGFVFGGWIVRNDNFFTIGF